MAIRAKSSMAAFGELYDLYMQPIYNFVLRRVGDEREAEDLVAQTFEKALLGIDRYEWQGISFSAWLYRIAANNVADHYRRRKRLKWVNIDEVEAIPHHDREKDRIEESDQHEIVLRSMQKLPPTYHLVLSLKFFEELDNQEMADILGCSKSNLAVKVYRSLRALRRIVVSEGVVGLEAPELEGVADA
ncbi:MAG: sigma-70 family RNA polymerase sigma factor [Candidatus Geothermincolia bacterium]